MEIITRDGWRSLMRLWFRQRHKDGSDKISDYTSQFRLILSDSVLASLHTCLSQKIKQKHEGIAYLLGKTDGSTTRVIATIRPKAKTTPGSFDVDLIAMARVVRAAADRGLQVVGQAHTHPRLAFHSPGDVSGTRIAYSGFVSIVIPHYGRLLPSLEGAAFFYYRDGLGFLELNQDNIEIISGRAE